MPCQALRSLRIEIIIEDGLLQSNFVSGSAEPKKESLQYVEVPFLYEKIRKEVKGGLNIRITRIDSRSFIEIGSEKLEISDFKMQSSADGKTELCITIRDLTNEFEMSTSLS